MPAEEGPWAAFCRLCFRETITYTRSRARCPLCHVPLVIGNPVDPPLTTAADRRARRRAAPTPPRLPGFE